MNLGERSQRSSTLFAVVSLHGVVFYILMTTVLHIPKVNHGPLQLVPTITHPRETVTMPNMRGIAIDIPKPVVTILRKPDPIEDVTTVVDPPIGPVAPPSEPSPHQVLQVQGGPGAGFPNPDDFYPPPAKYLEEQGVAIVQVCVDPKGRLTSVPTTLQGTGSSRLDQGALKLAAAGSGHYRASTEDGQAVNSCFPLRVRFQLKN
jgi:TonB family protein